MNILFTCAGRRTYLLEYFRANMQPADRIIATDMQLTASALTAADVKVQVPSVYDPQYLDILLDICRENAVDALISLNDLDLSIIAAAKHRFAALGVTVILSDSDTIETCLDKCKCMAMLQRAGLEAPATFNSLEAAEQALADGRLRFPVVVKPRHGSGSIGVEVVHDIHSLRELFPILKRHVQRSILAKVSQGDDCLLVQQQVTGTEYGVDIMNDLQGRTRAVAVKKKLAMRAGETDKAITVDHPAIHDVGYRLGAMLKHIGNLDVDIIDSDSHLYILDINPRFGGGFPFTYEAGANYPLALLKWLQGNDIDDSMLSVKPDCAFAKCDRLVSIKP